MLSFLPAFPVVLAPMAGVTDRAYRGLCREMGCDFTYTEMVSAKGLTYGNENTGKLLETAEAEHSFGVQLFGREPRILADTAKRLCQSYQGKLALIDINMGCPAQKIVKNGEGSALMLEPKLAGEIVCAVSRASSLPVTVKFRKGFDAAHENAVEFARILADNGAAMLSVHGRTRAQMYAGKADYDVIAAAKAAVGVPVLGNGDIFTGADAVRMRDATGCDGVMVARGAQGNPFIFQEVKAALANEPYTPPTDAARLDMAAEHARRMCAYCGDYGVIQLRKHMAWYVKGMRGAATFRTAVNGCATLEALLGLLAAYARELC
ncbi:MAG: tRNA dihydrouridine synthase DusB [Clostridia bacterium]|nr:tRNA dihydrouridine synthase DusB [Clostridia bacterium]